MKIEVRCPSCSKIGYIEVSEEAIKNIVRGLLAVNVTENITCQHSFVAYVDKNLQIRDYMLADFQIELPDAISDQEIEESVIPKAKMPDTDLIKLNLHAILIAFVIRAILFKKSAVIILDQDYLHENVLNFFHYITEKSFFTDITVLTKDQYEKNKKNYKNHIIFEGNNIITDKDKIIDIKQLKIETRFVQQFYANYESLNSLIVLKNEIKKAYQLSKTIGEFIKDYKEKETLNSKKIIDNISKDYGLKIQKPYFNFLIEIVKNYFKIEVPVMSDVANFLGYL